VADAMRRGFKEPKDKQAITGVVRSDRSTCRRNSAGYGTITWWEVEPGMGRVAHGVAHRVDRLATLGNGQVPAVVRAAWLLLSE
jgi:DNA (cytosine-5)-methyltransferase 1